MDEINVREALEQHTKIILDLAKRVNNLHILTEAQRRLIWFLYDHLNPHPKHLMNMTIRQIIDAKFDYGMDPKVAERFREELEYLANTDLRDPTLLLRLTASEEASRKAEPLPSEDAEPEPTKGAAAASA